MLNLGSASEILLAMYSAVVLDHFKNPRNAGEVAHPTAAVEVTNPVCGDVLRLSVQVADGRITEARFKAQGCVTAIACSSWLAEWVQNKTLEELRKLTAQEVSDALGGLPPATAHGSQLACDALEALLREMG